MFGRLFGTKKALENLTDKDGLLAKGGEWFGNLKFTEEEKAENDQVTRAWGVKQLSALEPFKVMQRIMVTIIMTEWAILLNCMIIAICFDNQEMFDNFLKLAMSKFAWMPISGAVILYLFGGVTPTRSP